MKAIEVQKLDNKIVLVAAIEFNELNSIVRFSNRVPSDIDPYDIEDVQPVENQTYYQRLTDSERVKEIVDFVEKTIIKQKNDNYTISTIFPSSMIIAFDMDKYEESSGVADINLPSKEFPCLIVDGQHRFAAMQKVLLKHEKNDNEDSKYIVKSILNYKFNCTVLINFDIWEQSQVFINVNFFQKKVNKSLYYDIFGSMPDSEHTSGMFLAHSLALFLNNSSKSPLNKFIKMLGTGEGYFSQAFLVEAIMQHFKEKGVWGNIVEDYKIRGDKHEILPKLFVAYFNAIKVVFKSEWPLPSQKKNSILCKTTGMGALVKLLGYVYKQLDIGTYPNQNKVNFNQINVDQLEKIFTEIFLPIKAKGEELFGSESIYAGAGSAGLQSKLYTRLGQELGLFKK